MMRVKQPCIYSSIVTARPLSPQEGASLTLAPIKANLGVLSIFLRYKTVHILFPVGKGGVVSEAIVTRVSSRIRERRGTHAVYSAYNALYRLGVVSAVIVLIN